YWFNPLLWMIRRTLQNLRELCCDATVARLLRENTCHYRQTLLETARQLLAEPVDPGLGLLGLFENNNWLVTRLQWLEKKTWKHRRLRIATIFALVAIMAACVLPMGVFNPGPPNFVIKGTVTDAETGQPIVGAKVGDNKEYNNGKFYTIADLNGNYEYKTWYEEHGTIAEADGYESQRKGFNTKLFGSEKEKIINYELMPADTKPVVRWSMAAVKDDFIKEIQNNGQYIKTKSKSYDCYKFSDTQVKYFFGMMINDPNQSVIFKTKDLWLLKPTGSHRIASARTDSGNLKNGAFVGYAVGGAGPYKFNYENRKYRLNIEHEAVNCLLNSGSNLSGAVFYKGDLTAGEALVFVGKMPETDNVQPYHLIIYLAGYTNKEESQNSELQTNNYTATLPNGVTVELVGVCDYPEKGEWWRADGVVFEPTLKIQTRDDLTKKKPKVIVFKVSENDFNARLYAEKLSSYTTLDVLDLQGNKLESYRAIAADTQSIDTLKSLEIQVAYGPWQTIAEYTDRSKFVDNDVVFSEPVSTDYGTMISATGEFDWSGSRQFVAFDKEGNKHQGGWAGRSTGNRTISQGRFHGIKPDNITKYQIKYQPYKIATFKNVSLRPGGKTEVQVTAGDSSELQQRVITAIDRYNRACYLRDYDLIEKSNYFESPEVRRRGLEWYKENFHRHPAPQKEYRKPKLHIIDILADGPDRYRVLTLTSSGYHKTYLVVSEQGILKIEVLTKERLDRMERQDQLGFSTSEMIVDIWQKAPDDELHELIQDRIRKEQDALLISQYARQHDIPMRSYMEVENIQNRLQDFQSLSEEQIRQKIIDEWKQNKSENDGRQPPVNSTLSSGTESTNSNFTATLPNGVTVELLGVCEYPSEGKQWWSPRGHLLSKAPYATTGNKEPHEKPGYQNYEFALRLQPADASYYWMIPGGSFGSDTGSPKDEDGRPLTNLKSYQTGLPKDQSATDIRFGVTAGLWETVATHKPDNREQTPMVGDYSIAFGIPYEKDNETLVPVVHNYNLTEKIYAIRMVAVTTSGQIRESGYSGRGGKELKNLTYSFYKLPLNEIREFQFQIRPYEWITFKNISLRLGGKTEVEIENQSSVPSPPASGKNSIRPGDVLEVSVYELLREGEETVMKREVSEDGFISLHGLSKPVKTEGLNTDELRDAVTQRYKEENVLHDPFVEITSHQKAGRPLTETIVQNVAFKKGMHLLDALQMLSKMYKVNIIPSHKVANGSTLISVTNLYDVTFEDILQAICGTTHTYEITDKFVYVYTNEEYAEKGHVFLGNWKLKHKVLDLATGEMVDYIADQYKETKDRIDYVKRLDKGDLLYSSSPRSLTVMRKGYASLWDGKVTKPIKMNKEADGHLTVYHIPKPPCRLLVTTAEGKQFDVKLLKDNGDFNIEIKYHPVAE
ncbi:MAG: polysaccharide biosynthesis/export family protein, partial [Planctomycetota bacterium]